MIDEQKDKVAFARRRLKNITAEQNQISTLLNPDVDNPELEKKVFEELSRLSMEAAECYKQMAESYD